eukprot:TRINITY_DN1661_c2_g1_i1.p1 TRINITY_DN1661_c2_g1~~TRINITY_DN1661_c2_g1_i1.p1  ORF type:complete len:300 (+),score=41.49 TRINITY_DN1661_c2_g1_i1:37-936(+)
MFNAGRFPEGNAIDRLDKWLSRPIFRLSLPWPLECLATVPASFFGCPLYSIGFVPVVVAAAPPQDSKFLKFVAGPITVGALGYWFKLCRESLTGKGITRAYKYISKAYVLLLPNLAMAVATVAGSEAGAKASAHYLSSWFFAQLLIEVAKGTAWRLRPTWAMKDELAAVPRAIADITSVVKHASQANLSFPSGDAAGGAIFATAVSAAAPALRGPAVATAVLCGLGRMYFHCHHLLDVVVGQAIGFGVAWLVQKRLQPNWYLLLFSQAFLVGLWKPAQMLKPKAGAKQELEINSLDKGD